MSRTAQTGIETRHKKDCGTRTGKICTCRPSYRGTVYDAEQGKKRSGPWTQNLAEARGWRVDAQHRLRHGGFTRDHGLTLDAAATRWFEAAASGVVRSRGGARYKPATLRNYRCSFDLHVRPVLGATRLSVLRRGHVQALVDRLTLTLAGSTVQNAIEPLRVICRHAQTREWIATNPCEGIELPARDGRRFVESEDGGAREAIATPQEANDLIAALPGLDDRAIWATAIYAGLRRGELRGLRRSEIDLNSQTISVNRGWDSEGGAIAPKTAHGKRTVPIINKLETILTAHLQDHDGREFAFPGYGRWGRDYGPFSADALLKRSRKTWLDRELQPILLHEARHTYASLLLAAGVPLALVSKRMGHASVAVTERVYFHLLPDVHENEREKLNALLG